MWYVWSERQWKLMFTFMQNAFNDAWDNAINYDDFKENIFRFNVPSGEGCYYKVYLRSLKQCRIYRPTNIFVKVL